MPLFDITLDGLTERVSDAGSVVTTAAGFAIPDGRFTQRILIVNDTDSTITLRYTLATGVTFALNVLDHTNVEFTSNNDLRIQALSPAIVEVRRPGNFATGALADAISFAALGAGQTSHRTSSSRATNRFSPFGRQLQDIGESVYIQAVTTN